ncbi:uncharacterized protein N7482_005451 [Penicillium canariense]|uniref:Nephrocystin 3-like N-terminal domain-containing protein n=1 Tax=Penicillium canariense TaxID=189055 RepID=A0A9W9I4X0_9EURO|nr:uncharacterized protein N7482_005451 [Penicillium canariense]KAJ5166670.1 hypothetical protein N7482_005451 [Penicillium canariense]
MNPISFGNANAGFQFGSNHGPIHISSDRPETPPQTIDNEVLRSLAFPQMLDRRDNIEPCHPNTCQWILEMEEYKSWRSQSRGLLWIKGKPGAGKSTLMVFLHDKLKSLRDQGLWLDFFFTARGTEMQRTPLGMLRSLLNQIFDRDETVRPQVREAYEQRCRQFGYGERKWEWPRVVLEELLASAILTSATQQHITIFVDALDEAGTESAQRLVAYFHRVIDRADKQKVTVQICLSCRHYPIIGNARATEIHIEDYNHEDIATYIKDILADTEVRDGPSQETREVLVEQLTQQANGVFQWAHLVMPLIRQKILEGESFNDIRCWLHEVPAGLEDAYTYILNNVIDDRNREHSFLLFQWVCLAERPLTVTEMRYAMAARHAGIMTSPLKTWEKIDGFVESNERMKRRIKTLSGGLAEVVSSEGSNETVQAVHQSVNDFLHGKGLGLLYQSIGTSTSSMDEGNIHFLCHATLYGSCLAYLATVHIPEELCGVRRVKRDNFERAQKDLVRDHPLLTYATIYLFVHAEKAAGSRADVLSNEQAILQQVFGHWVQIYQIIYPFKSACPPTGTTLLHMAAAANLVDVIESVLPNSEDIAKKDGNGNTAFHIAAQEGHLTVGKLLRKKGANWGAHSPYETTALIEAASCGRVRFVEWLLHEGAKIEATEHESGEALQLAPLGGNQSVVEILLGAGTEINSRSGKFGNALQAAAWKGHTKIVRMLLDAHADVNAQGGEFGNALQAAALGGSIEIVQMLLDAHADVNAQGGEFGNALQAAAWKGHTKIVRMLLDAHADVNAQGGEFGNALQAAALGGSIEIVQMLLDAHADVNTQGDKYANALQTAAGNGRIEIVRMLLGAHADVNAQGGEFGNALQAAAWKEHTKIVRMLLDAHADVNAQGGEFGNALQAAASEGNTEMVQMLLDAHADVNAQGMLIDAQADVNAPGGPYGSPLLAAVHEGDSDQVQILLNAGADPLLSDELDHTPLHIAASRGMLHILCRFSQLASAINKRDKLLQSPLHLAVCFGHIEFAIMLLDLGADPSLPDSYGRNIMDWALEHQTLMLHIRNHCPQIVLTPDETQKLTVRQSILQISDTLLRSKLDSPWRLLQQLGRYFLFLDDVDNARRLLQFRLSQDTFFGIDPRNISCDICEEPITESHFVCGLCVHMDLCSSCVQDYPYHSRLHPKQEHKIFQVPDVPDNESRLTRPASEELSIFLSNLVHEFLSQKTETEPSNDSVFSPAPNKTALVSRTLLGPGTMALAILFGLTAVLLGCWYF